MNEILQALVGDSFNEIQRPILLAVFNGSWSRFDFLPGFFQDLFRYLPRVFHVSLRTLSGSSLKFFRFLLGFF